MLPNEFPKMRIPRTSTTTLDPLRPQLGLRPGVTPQGKGLRYWPRVARSAATYLKVLAASARSLLS